jgi:hypothetical protein
MAGNGPLNYTTTVDAEKTAYECLAMLGRFGASQIGITFRDDRMPDGLSFVLMTRWGRRGFDLPVDAASTLKVLTRAAEARRIRPGYAHPEQADRVAWRVMKDWLESQLALIEAGLMDAERVLSPYMLVEPGKTMLDIYAEQHAIAAGAS